MTPMGYSDTIALEPVGHDPNWITKPHLEGRGVTATFQSLCKRMLGSNSILVLCYQVIDIILHNLFLLSCVAAPKGGPTHAATSQDCFEDTRGNGVVVTGSGSWQTGARKGGTIGSGSPVSSIIYLWHLAR